MQSFSIPISRDTSLLHTQLGAQYYVQLGGGKLIMLDWSVTGGFQRSSYQSTFLNGNYINIPVDPLTALRCGAITVAELELPPGLEALFNILK